MTKRPNCPMIPYVGRRQVLQSLFGVVGSLVGAAVAGQPGPAEASIDLGGAGGAAFRPLSLLNEHTGESLTIDFTKGEQRRPETRAAERWFLRDHHDGSLHDIDPRLLETVFLVARLVGHKGPVRVLSGYRSPATNAMLRLYHEGVAVQSYHMQGKAIDFHLPGCPLAEVHKAAVSLKAGGVGYYPASNFIHVDVGPVRYWGGGTGRGSGPQIARNDKDLVLPRYRLGVLRLGDNLLVVPRGFTGLTPYQARRLTVQRRALQLDRRHR